jgi:hypothetical protein
MDQLGAGIRFTARVDRRLCIEGTRFAVRRLPALRRTGRGTLAVVAVVLALAVLTTQRGLADGDELGEVLGATAPLWIGAVSGAVLGSGRFRARVLAAQTLADLPDERDVAYRFDAEGYEARGDGMATRFDWPIVSAVAEGDRFIAIGAGRRFMVCPAERLSDAERAAIRRWAEAAPGERTWDVWRGSRRSDRLHVSPSPPAAAGDRPPIATVD